MPPSKPFFPTLDAWSYSRYNDYKRCPFMFAHKQLLKMKDPNPGPALIRGRDVHKVAELALVGPKWRKVPPELVHFEEEFRHLRDLNPTVEQQWGFTRTWDPTGWFGSDTWCRVVLDAVVVYDDNTAVVIDHKTGKKYATNEDQMQLFALATFKKFPEVTEVSTRLWYLDQPTDNEVEYEYHKREEAAIQKDWERNIKPMFADRKFPPRPNDKCRFCFLSKAKGGPCKF
jgi:CRISPR/Cas system-associated exonuclease Cas4 (RecB family)